MKRINISLAAIAERKNIVSAFHKAAKGKQYRSNVQSFLRDFDTSINQLGRDIRAGCLPYGRFRSFRIFDPKERIIHAACFPDRVFHHALMNQAGIVLERAMTSFSYACRPGMGVHRAVKKVQQHLRQYPYYVKIDIKGYFAAIPHQRMIQVLERRFKGECIEQFRRVLACFETAP